jgi:DNA repair photolyase
MISEIETRTILNYVKQPDPYFGLKYNMNLYRGCQHQCIYCDSRSECYQLGDLADIRVKVNAIDLLEQALPRKRVRGTICFGSMNDTYMPVERTYGLTRRALEVIARYGFPIHIITKSDLVVRDLDLLQEINQIYAAVSFTITAGDDSLARRVEPGAPPTSARLAAMRALSAAGIHTGVTMMPILPFIEDTPENITQIVTLAQAAGAEYILPWFGMSLRAGSRDYYYQKLDRLFPGIKARYIRHYGDRYECNSPYWRVLDEVFQKLVAQYGLSTRMPVYTPQKITHPAKKQDNGQQLPLF